MGEGFSYKCSLKCIQCIYESWFQISSYFVRPVMPQLTTIKSEQNTNKKQYLKALESEQKQAESRGEFTHERL